MHRHPNGQVLHLCQMPREGSMRIGTAYWHIIKYQVKPNVDMRNMTPRDRCYTYTRCLWRFLCKDKVRMVRVGLFPTAARNILMMYAAMQMLNFLSIPATQSYPSHQTCPHGNPKQRVNT